MKSNLKSTWGIRYVLSVMVLLGLSSLFVQCGESGISEEGTALEEGFKNPPHAAKPRVWWHWMNGNVSWEGAKADMDWMTRVGIGGLQAFHGGGGPGEEAGYVENWLPYMSDGWKDAFAKTAAYADSLGLELATAGSPGWSETGGPWVTPEDGMKKMAYAVTYVDGGQPFTGVLNHPPKTTGVYQTSTGRSGHRRDGPGAELDPVLYKDQKVLAFQIPEDAMLPNPVITSSGGRVDVDRLTDGIYDEPAISLPVAKEVGGISWIQLDYGRPVTVRGLEVSYLPGNPVEFRLESSDDGVNWTDTDTEINTASLSFASQQAIRTNSVDNVTARYFRFVSIKQPPAPPVVRRWGRGPTQPKNIVNVTELEALGTPTVHSFEVKAAYWPERGEDGYFGLPSGSGSDAAVKTSEVVDLTDKLNGDGTLDWNPPEGKWLVLRMGYSLTGYYNRPAAEEATGLEVDKMDSTAVKRYIDTYIDMYRDAANGLVGERGLRAIMFDSFEAGFTNWTPRILENFEKRWSYDPVPWLPALAGYVVESPEQTDKFLWDWRRNIQLMIKENHYDFLTRYLHNIGMFRYGEGHESGFATMADGMEMKQSADVPMGAMWMQNTPGEIRNNYYNDNQESASVANIYGQNISAAESFTGGPGYGTAPWDLKPTADAILLAGTNRFVIHTSAHQPISKGPGMTLGVGQMFSRNETWAEQSKPWIDYLARTSFMLQAGKAANDLAVFYGEESSESAIYGSELPNIPNGYRYDYVSADALLNMLSVENGALTTESGMDYKAIFLGKGAKKMTLPVLRKLKEFVEQGAVVIGTRPEDSPSLADDPQEVQELLDMLWPGGASTTVGKGTVYNTNDPATALSEMGLQPDFSYESSKEESDVMFLTRKLGNGERVYFLASMKDQEEAIQGSFRISGYKAELWDPTSGEISPATYSFDGDRTTVTIPLERFGSVFVVFRDKTQESSMTVPDIIEQVVGEVEGPWQVGFQEGRGAPASTTFDELIDFRDSPDPGIRYFSGIASYTNSMEVSQESIDQGNVVLDLGEVNNLAEVWVNGNLAGTAWRPPFRVDITDHVRAGSNEIEIKSVNLWVNRLIGDAQPDIKDEDKITVPAGRQYYNADSPLVPSGLLGPVNILSISKEK